MLVIYNFKCEVFLFFLNRDYLYFLGQKLKIQLRKEPKIKPTRPKQRSHGWESRNNALWGLSFAPGQVKIDLPSQVNFVKNVIVGHVRDFSQVLKRQFPFNPPLNHARHPMTCFLNGPLQFIENHVSPRPPDDPWKTASWEEPDTTEPF